MIGAVPDETRGGRDASTPSRHHRPVLVDPSSTDALPDESDPRLRDEVAPLGRNAMIGVRLAAGR